MYLPAPVQSTVISNTEVKKAAADSNQVPYTSLHTYHHMCRYMIYINTAHMTMIWRNKPVPKDEGIWSHVSRKYWKQPAIVLQH